jgi:hypothetical protein
MQPRCKRVRPGRKTCEMRIESRLWYGELFDEQYNTYYHNLRERFLSGQVRLENG